MAHTRGIPFDDLDPYARRFAARLFSAYPEWRALATLPPWSDAHRGALYVELCSPVDPRLVLSVTTDRGEITVEFGDQGWHTHFGTCAEMDEATSFGQALDMIGRILAEDVVLVQSFVGDEPGWSEVVAAGEQSEFGNAERLEIASWMGHWNATVFPA